MDNKIIKTIIDGIEVEGEVLHRDSGDFTVVITKPFQNIKGGLHIPYFSRPYHSFDGAYGDNSLLDALSGIYEIGTYLFENINSLKGKVCELDRKIERLSENKITETEYKNIRIKLRRVLKDGEISHKYYQKILKWWRAERESLRVKIWLQTDIFFQDNFPMIVPVSNRDGILKIIRSETGLMNELGEGED
jgi:hypothetical protein